MHVLVRGWEPSLGMIDRVCLPIDVAMELIDVSCIVVFCNVYHIAAINYSIDPPSSSF